MGSGHLLLGALHFTGAMKRQRQLSTGQSNYTNSWPAALLSHALFPSLSQFVPFSVHLSLNPRHSPFSSTSGVIAPQRSISVALLAWLQIFTVMS